mgnify:CR=1 FL=1
MNESKKAGRKTLANRKLTYAEIKQRQRMKMKLLKNEMKEIGGYYLESIFLHPKQIEALSYIDKMQGGNGVDLIDPTNLSFLIFTSIRDYIENSSQNIDLEGPLAKLINSGDLPMASVHECARMNAENKYADWAQQHIEELQ